MKRHWMLILIIGVLLSVSAMVSPVQAANVNTFILSNEGGGLISEMVAAGMAHTTSMMYCWQYQTIQTRALTVITDQFFLTLQSCGAAARSLPII